jgi:hypothetical protein
MTMRDDESDSKKHGDGQTEPTRDARGRWRKGYCPNPKGRPRKKPKAHLDQSDLRWFGRTSIEVRTNDGVKLMDRRAALLHKMFEDAMRGKVSMQRFLYAEFERNAERLAELRHRYDQLINYWYLDKKNFESRDGEDIPLAVELEIASLEALLNHYFPGQYSTHRATDQDDDD